MAEVQEVNDVLQVTGLTPSAPAEPASEPPAAPPEESGEAKPAEQPAAAEKDEAQEATAQAPAAPAETATEEPAATEPKKPSRGVQKALDRLTDRAVKAETERDQLSAAMVQVLTQLRQPQTPPAAAVPKPIETAPERKNFADWEEFNRATAQWEARQTARQELGGFMQALAGQQRQNIAQAEAMTLTKKLHDAVEKAPERFPDWDDTVVASDAPMPPSLAHAVMISDDPALVMHHFGKHPEEHARLLQLTPQQQLYQVGRIVASAQIPASVPSKAPAPAKPVGGNKSVSTPTYTDEMTPEQHRAYMKRQGADRGLR